MTCMCQPDSMFKEHILYTDDLKGDQTLLQTSDHFCSAFFHVSICTEWANAFVCLNTGGHCTRHIVVLVVNVLDSNGNSIAISRYRNCYRGSSNNTIHAEDFMMADPRLHSNLAKAGNHSRIEMYCTYQPCHFSGGSVHQTSHPKSCSVALLAFAEDIYTQYRTKIDFYCSGVYRANWTDSKMYRSHYDAMQFDNRTNSARTGIMIIQKSLSLKLCAFTSKQWDFLLSLADIGVIKSISPQQLKHRMAFDAQVNILLTYGYKEYCLSRDYSLP
jgi:hypothetical protein